MIGLAAALLALALRSAATRWRIATAVFALGMAHYLLVRPDPFHTAPLAVLVACSAAWALASSAARRLAAGVRRRWWRRRASPSPSSRAPTAAGSPARGHRARCELDVADGVRVPPARRRRELEAVRARRARARAARASRSTWPRGAPTSSPPAHPLLYVLADRPNPTRYDIAAPGVVTSAPVQREIVARPRAHPHARGRALDTSPVTAAPEPNAAGRSTGVRILDDYLARRYRAGRALGTLRMLARRAAEATRPRAPARPLARRAAGARRPRRRRSAAARAEARRREALAAAGTRAGSTAPGRTRARPRRAPRLGRAKNVPVSPLDVSRTPPSPARSPGGRPPAPRPRRCRTPRSR